MVKWNREQLINELVSEISKELPQGQIFESKDLQEMVEDLNVSDPLEEKESKILYLAWHIPSGVLPPAAEAIINLLVEEAFKKD